MPFTVKKLKAINTGSLDKLGDSVVDLAKFTEDEFAQVAASFLDSDPDKIWNSVPPKPRRGTYFYADGTHWNPGSGEGAYTYDGSAYHFLGNIGTVAEAPLDSQIYARQNGAWVPILTSLTNSLGADVNLTGTGLYFIGPQVAQGTSGTWFVSGSVVCTDTAGAARINARLTDGTTIIATGQGFIGAAGQSCNIALSGFITSPAANLRINCRDITSVSGKILFNQTGDSKDSTISAIRIA